MHQMIVETQEGDPLEVAIQLRAIAAYIEDTRRVPWKWDWAARPIPYQPLQYKYTR